MVWPFKWILFKSTFTLCNMFFSVLQNGIWKFCQILTLPLLGVKGLRQWLKFIQFRTIFICLQKRGILPVNQLKLSAVCSTAVLKTFYRISLLSLPLFWTRERNTVNAFKFLQWIFRKKAKVLGTVLAKPATYQVKHKSHENSDINSYSMMRKD